VTSEWRKFLHVTWRIVEVLLLFAGCGLGAYLCWRNPPGAAGEGAAGALGTLGAFGFLLAFLLVSVPAIIWARRWWGPIAAIPPAAFSLVAIVYLILGWPLSVPMGAPGRLLWAVALAFCALLVGLPFAMVRLWYVPVGAVVAGLLIAWIRGAVAFLSPGYLFLLLTIPVVWWCARRSLSGLGAERRSLSLYIRSLVILFLILSMARTRYMEPSRDLAVFFLLDCSRSVPLEAKKGSDKLTLQEKLFKYMHESTREKYPHDMAGVVAFGREPSIERSLLRSHPIGEESGIRSIVARDATDIAAAIRLACTFFPENARRRIVVFSDGNENRGSAIEAAQWAAEQGVHFDVYPITYKHGREVMVERIIVPPDARPDEPFRVTIVLRSNCATKGMLSLVVGEIEERPFPIMVELEPGRPTIVTHEMRRRLPGFYDIAASFRPDDQDSDEIFENNTARGFTHGVGKAQVLIIEEPENEGEHLAETLGGEGGALSEEGVVVERRGMSGLPRSEADFLAYDLIILCNVPRSAWGDETHMRMLQSAVKDGGVGFIMIGGNSSFGAGGYIDTPIEETLPVDLRLKDKEMMPNGALALIMHTCEMPKGNYWMKKICHAAVETLGPEDYFGMLLYSYATTGGSPVIWQIPMGPVSRRSLIKRKIDLAQPGDMPDYDTAIRMAYRGLLSQQAAVKHIILIGDGDAVGASPRLIQSLVKAKITASTVTVFPHSPGAPQAMKNLAQGTKGTFYYPKNPNNLPKIFIREASRVRQSMIYNQEFRPKVGERSEPIKGLDEDDFPSLMAHVGTSAATAGPKVRAEIPLLAVIAQKEGGRVENPLLAHWQYGLGRSVAFTSDATGNWAKNWIGRGDIYQKFWKQTTLWAMRKRPRSNLQVRTAVDGENVRVVVEAIDDDGEPMTNLDLQANVVDPEQVGTVIVFRQTAPGLYETSF